MIISALLLPSCAPAAAAEPLYNGYLGLEFRLPAGWEVDYLGVANVSDKSGAPGSLSEMTLDYDDDGDSYVNLMEVTNGGLSVAEAYLSAHITDEYGDLRAYADIIIQTIGAERSGRRSGVRFAGSSEVTINGIKYQRIRHTITEAMPGYEMGYGYDIYIAKLGGAIFSVDVKYDLNDPVSCDFAKNFMKRIFPK